MNLLTLRAKGTTSVGLTTEGLAGIVDLVTNGRDLPARPHLDHQRGESDHPQIRLRRDRVSRHGKVERRAFWATRRSPVLLLALLADAGVGILIGLFGLSELRPLPFIQTAFVISYALACSLVANDFVNLALVRHQQPGQTGDDRKASSLP